METEGKVRLTEFFVGLRDPRQAKKVEHDLVEMLVVAVCAVLVGAENFVEIEESANHGHCEAQPPPCAGLQGNRGNGSRVEIDH